MYKPVIYNQNVVAYTDQKEKPGEFLPMITKTDSQSSESPFKAKQSYQKMNKESVHIKDVAILQGKITEERMVNDTLRRDLFQKQLENEDLR